MGSRIQDETTRIARMRELSAELANDVRELSTLYGVDAMVVVYNPPSVEPLAVWPPNPTRVVERYLATPEADRTAVNMESYPPQDEVELQPDELAPQSSSSSTEAAAGEGINHAGTEPDSGKQK
ncbi:hypothetical protein LINGRAHAP2_LOCUS26134, partial [Linum grandiflorum]